LINAAFEGHSIAQINYDRGLRNVEEHDRKQPEEKVSLAELGRRANPTRTHDEQNLGENEIAQTEWLFERVAVFLNAALSAVEIDCHDDAVGA
jgi:hypothetical protein